MSKKTIFMLIVIFLLPVILYLLWPSDENRIRKLFREGAKAVEEEKIDEVMAKISFTYSDDQGLSYLLLKQAMTRVFERMSGMSVEYRITHIEIRENGRAEADLDVRVIATWGKDIGYIAGDAENPLRLKFFLEKEQARWLVVKAEGIPFRF